MEGPVPERWEEDEGRWTAEIVWYDSFLPERITVADEWRAAASRKLMSLAGAPAPE